MGVKLLLFGRLINVFIDFEMIMMAIKERWIFFGFGGEAVIWRASLKCELWRTA